MRRKILTNLKTMLSFAQGRGLVAQNVARGVRIKLDKRETTGGPLRAGVDFPTMAELNTLIENSTGRWRPFIITAIFTGMRLSELRGLRWNDVDLEAGQIHVRQRADAWLKIGPTKSKAGMRDIPLAPMVVNTLKQWQIDCPKGELDLVFPNTRGNVETMPNIHSRCWVPLQLKCGLTTDGGQARYGFHMLRHAAASLFIKYLGWSPKRLQAVMGNASINMTFDRYGHLFENIEADRADMARSKRPCEPRERHRSDTREETETKSKLQRGQSSRCSSVKSIGSTPSLTPNARSRCRITAKMEPNSYVAKHAINPHSRVYRWDDNRAGVFCALARRSGLFASS